MTAIMGSVGFDYGEEGMDMLDERQHMRMAALLLATLTAGCATWYPESHALTSIPPAADVPAITSSSQSIQPSHPDGGWTLSNYVGFAFANNNELRAALNRSQAALARAGVEGSLKNPDLAVEYYPDSADSQWQATIKQEVPISGKLRLARQIAEAEAKAAEQEFEAVRLDVYKRVVRAFGEYFYLARATDVTAETLKLVESIEAAIRARYETGSASFSDLLNIQVEKDRMRSELATLQDERDPRSAALAAAIGLQIGSVLPWPALPRSTHAQVDENALMGMIEQLNPELKALELMAVRAEYSEELARREYYPDIMLGVGVMGGPGTGSDSYMWNPGVMVGISLPLWIGKTGAMAKEAAALRLAADDSKREKTLQLTADLKMAIFAYRDAERRLALYRDSLVPRARQAVDAALQNYSAGRTEFMTLLNSQRTLLNARLSQERAAVDSEIAMAEIGCCIVRYVDMSKSQNKIMPAAQPVFRFSENLRLSSDHELKGLDI